MALPDLDLYIGLDCDLEIKGPGTVSYNFNSFTWTKLSCVALGILLSTEDAAQLEKTLAGANVLAHFLKAHVAGKTPGVYPYQLYSRSGSKDLDVAGQGKIIVRDAA